MQHCHMAYLTKDPNYAPIFRESKHHHPHSRRRHVRSEQDFVHAKAMAQRRANCRGCSGTVGVAKRRREVGDSGSGNADDSNPGGSGNGFGQGSCPVGGHLDYPADLRAILGTMMEDKELQNLCDVVIIVEDVRFPAHRAVLAAASAVFKAMFTTSNMRESKQSEVVLKEISPASWQMAQTYIYTAQVDIADQASALLLLESARMYQLETLEAFVENFLISRLTVANCFNLLGHAEVYDLEELKRESKGTMEERFEAVALSPAFLKCPLPLLRELLGSRDLVIRSEMDVFDAITRWVTGPTENGQNGEAASSAGSSGREVHLDHLLRNVDLSKLNETQLKSIARHVLVRNCSPFREAALERLLYSTSDAVGDALLAAGWHLKARKRCARVFTFAFQQRGMTVSSSADDEEVVRTPWALDDTGRIVWRLKIYPRGYNKAKGHYLSMYVQARRAFESDNKLDLSARFDIFLTNRKDAAATISFSSHHRFTEQSDHWGFHRFLPLGNMLDASVGFMDVESDSLLVGANIYY